MMTSITGGCQCGAIRYELSEAPQSEFCHCGMCRRASGGAFAALATVPKAAFRWTKGTPRTFDSSTAAQRGFCGDCGTPLTFAPHASKSMDVSIGSLDDPEALGPLKLEFAVESRLSWLAPTEGAHQQRLDEYKAAPAFQPGFRSLQAPRKEAS
jgi:hypothetical protein